MSEAIYKGEIPDDIRWPLRRLKGLQRDEQAFMDVIERNRREQQELYARYGSDLIWYSVQTQGMRIPYV